ncbi:hypothetical protein [Tritonibacter horizontis]|uniref:Uncharacterized protein n=1 Tax=Tritonibacter horizontis TaxID=1768241 RepID=A0A132C3H3_9RHOB|nr:hypothetical protein [Tritonibacter horizontis]KUP95076.1 hypothetical protein TRIHO_00340 [Tritonibacter horizontis]
MDKETFAKRLAQSMTHTSESLVAGAQHPTGRGVSAERSALAAWLHGLDDEGRKWVHHLVDEGVHAGVFGLLCVLDHVRFVEDGDQKGSFTLTYTAPTGAQTQINPDKGEMLHDLYNGLRREAQK